MAVGTERLSRTRKLVTPRELGILFLALAVMAMLIYLWQGRESPVPRVEGLSGSAVENSGAFARERGALVSEAPEAIFGSGAYVRESAGTASVALTPAAIQTSGAHIRELGAQGTDAESFSVWTYAREAMEQGTERLSSDAMLNSGAHIREAAS